ncbi:PqqD family protein [bacterium]|nr:PqqD family protein [bacterium]
MELKDKIFKPKVKGDIIVKNIDEEKVLFNPLNSRIHILNKTAFPIWQLADGTNTIDDIIRELTSMFEKPDANYNVEEDVLNLLTEFKNQGLLE